MCTENRTLEEILVHATIGRLGVDYDALNAWARSFYRLHDDSWNPWGAGDPNDKSRPYGKTINAIFVIGYLLSDNHDLQWHSLEDYESLACSQQNRFHSELYMRMIRYNGSAEATAVWGVFADEDRTDLHCPLYDQGSPSNFPSHRAAVLVHEAWHHWLYTHGFEPSHGSGGAARWGEGDYYHFHTVSAYEFGFLHTYSTTPHRFHTPFQVEAEFFADLAELARPETPIQVCQTARAHGNTLLENAFINPAPYRIGDPRPW